MTQIMLTNGKEYAVLTKNKKISKTNIKKQATIFLTRKEAEEVLYTATKKLRGFYILSTQTDTSPNPQIKLKADDTSSKCERIDIQVAAKDDSKRRTFSQAERNDVYANDEGRCAICGKFVRFDEFTVDHIIPLAKGGTNEMSNLQCSCVTCNRIKQDILPQDLMEKLTDIMVYQLKKKENKRFKKIIRKIAS